MLGQSRFVRRFRLWAVPRMAPAMLASALAGCASFSSDAGMGGVNSVVAPQLGTAALKVGSGETTANAAAQTRALLRTPLSAEAAVRIALLNNKGLQASYNGLGIAEAVMVEASLPPSPTISLSRIATPVELDIESRIVADILALATLPARTEIAADKLPTSATARSRRDSEARRRNPAPLLPRRRGRRNRGRVWPGGCCGRNDSEACRRAWRDRRHEQARSGARKCIPRRCRHAA